MIGTILAGSAITATLGYFGYKATRPVRPVVKNLIKLLESDDGWKFKPKTDTTVPCWQLDACIFTFAGDSTALKDWDLGGILTPSPLKFTAKENRTVQKAVENLQNRQILAIANDRATKLLEEQNETPTTAR